jgi:TM2 domain-containing membrane protein YozV
MKTICSLFFLFVFIHSYANAQTNRSVSLLKFDISNVHNDLSISANNQLAMLPPTDTKDPLTAMLLSAAWPGIGQFYVGEPIKGTLMAVGQLGLLIPLLDALKSAKTEKYGDTNEYRAEIILALMIGNLVYSVVDAGKAARDYVALRIDKLDHIATTDYAMTVEMSFKIPF